MAHQARFIDVVLGILALCDVCVGQGTTQENCRASFALDVKICDGAVICDDEALRVGDTVEFAFYVKNSCTKSSSSDLVSAEWVPGSTFTVSLAASDSMSTAFPFAILQNVSYQPAPTPGSSSFAPSGQCRDASCGVVTVHDLLTFDPGETRNIGNFTATAIRVPEASLLSGDHQMYTLGDTDRTALRINDSACRPRIRGGASGSTIAIFEAPTTTTSTTSGTTTTKTTITVSTTTTSTLTTTITTTSITTTTTTTTVSTTTPTSTSTTTRSITRTTTTTTTSTADALSTNQSMISTTASTFTTTRTITTTSRTPTSSTSTSTTTSTSRAMPCFTHTSTTTTTVRICPASREWRSRILVTGMEVIQSVNMHVSSQAVTASSIIPVDFPGALMQLAVGTCSDLRLHHQSSSKRCLVGQQYACTIQCHPNDDVLPIWMIAMWAMVFAVAACCLVLVCFCYMRRGVINAYICKRSSPRVVPHVVESQSVAIVEEIVEVPIQPQVPMIIGPQVNHIQLPVTVEVTVVRNPAEEKPIHLPVQKVSSEEDVVDVPLQAQVQARRLDKNTVELPLQMQAQVLAIENVVDVPVLKQMDIPHNQTVPVVGWRFAGNTVEKIREHGPTTSLGDSTNGVTRSVTQPDNIVREAHERMTEVVVMQGASTPGAWLLTSSAVMTDTNSSEREHRRALQP